MVEQGLLVDLSVFTIYAPFLHVEYPGLSLCNQEYIQALHLNQQGLVLGDIGYPIQPSSSPPIPTGVTSWL